MDREKRFNIHIRAWGAGLIVFGLGSTIILASTESLWFLFLLLLVGIVGWVVWRNERLPGGIEK